MAKAKSEGPIAGLALAESLERAGIRRDLGDDSSARHFLGGDGIDEIGVAAIGKAHKGAAGGVRQRFGGRQTAHTISPSERL